MATRSVRITPQHDGFLDDEPWDFQSTPEDNAITLREGECLVIRHATEAIQLTQEHPLAVRLVSRR